MSWVSSQVLCSCENADITLLSPILIPPRALRMTHSFKETLLPNTILSSL